jgi:ankyrin repeat protein
MDVRNKADATPLHLAARHGHTEIARFLCLAGLNISLQDKVNTIFCLILNKDFPLSRTVELLVN